MTRQVAELNWGLIETVWLWMAMHPLQSIAYLAAGLVVLFSIETKLHELKQRNLR